MLERLQKRYHCRGCSEHRRYYFSGTVPTNNTHSSIVEDADGIDGTIFLVLYLHDRVFMKVRQLQVLMVSMALDPHGIVYLAYAIAER